MPMPRSNFAAQLEPGLNTLFGLEYKQYPEQWRRCFQVNSSVKAFEEDVLLEGFAAAPIKAEGAAITYETASEVWTARYNHDVIALAFSMQHPKEITGANIFNRAFNSSYTGGDGKELCATDHPSRNGDWSNELATAADLNETSLEQMLINISDMVDDRGIPIAASGKGLIIPTALVFIAERLLKSIQRVDSAENDINAIRSIGLLPDGYDVVQRLTDTDAWFVKTDVPDGLKMFQRKALKKGTEGDFETGNMRYKTTERYSFGWTNPRGLFGSPGA